MDLLEDVLNLCALFFLLSLSSSLASELEQDVVRVLWNLLFLCSYPVLLTTRHLEPLLSLPDTGNASPSSKISFKGVDVEPVLPGEGMVLYLGVNDRLSFRPLKGRRGIDTVDDSVRIVVVVVVVLVSDGFDGPIVDEESKEAEDRCCDPILHLFTGTGPIDFKQSDTDFGLFSEDPFLDQPGNDPSSKRFFRFSWLVQSSIVAAGTLSTSWLPA